MRSNKELLSDLGINLNRITTTGKTVCPKCSHERKKKNDPCLSVNVQEGVYKCHNCDWKGTVQVKPQFEKKEYFKPIFNNRTELPVSMVNYFFERGISQQTLLEFKITAASEFMPQTGKQEKTIQFNYFRNGQLVNIKSRTRDKHFKLVKDAELIFFNLDAIAECNEVIITEGEIDAMSWHEAGFKNVVSVPNGAAKNQKLEYLDNCYEYFENKTKIYLSTDNDERGIELREELARRFGKERCFKLDYGDFKDVNEYLVAKGEQSLITLLNESKEYPIEGVFNIDDVWEDLYNVYLNGLPEGDKTGDRQFDEHLRCMLGELTMVTGIPNHGKSIFLDQMTLGLCLNSNWEFGVFSPESYPIYLYYQRLIKRLLGKKFSKRNINELELNAVREWLRSRYHLIFPEAEGFSLDVILQKAKALVLKKGIKGLIIDPWNRIEDAKPAGMNDGEWIIRCLVKIISFAQQNGVHVFCVAHPTKMQKDKEGINFLVPNMYSISGSAHFFNLTQNGITVYRNYTTGKTEVHIQKVKWEHLGKIGMIEYVYCEENARFYAEGEDPYKSWLPSIAGNQLELTESSIQPNTSFYADQDWEKVPF